MIDSEVFITVYNNLREINERVTRTVYGQINKSRGKLIQADTLKELLQMARNGQIKEYYERIKNNAV